MILLIFQCSLTSAYELGKKNNFGKSLSGYKINDNDKKEVAQIYFLDPENTYHFFSVETNQKLFDNIPEEINHISLTRNIKPLYALLADFSKPIVFEKKFSFSYFFNFLEILIFAPPYLKKATILDPNYISKRFFMSLEIEHKKFYGVIIFSKAMNIKNVKNIIIETKNLKQSKLKLFSLLDFPIALVTFDDSRTITVYESHKNIKKYSCLFLAGK